MKAFFADMTYPTPPHSQLSKTTHTVKIIPLAEEEEDLWLMVVKVDLKVVVR
jgi:hypothetical protein